MNLIPLADKRTHQGIFTPLLLRTCRSQDLHAGLFPSWVLASLTLDMRGRGGHLPTFQVNTSHLELKLEFKFEFKLLYIPGYTLASGLLLRFLAVEVQNKNT